PHGQVWVKGHGFISWHGAGFAFAVVPGVWIGDAFDQPITGIQGMLLLYAALSAVLLLALLRRLGSALGARPIVVWAAWLSSAAGLEVVSFAERFYPEGLALLCILIAVNCAAVRRPRWPHLLVGSIAASYLPWLHIRFIPVCFGLLLVLALRGLSAAGPAASSGWLWPTRAEIAAGWRVLRSRAGVTVLSVVAVRAVPAMVSFGYMAYEFNYWYGSPSWTAMTAPGPDGSLAWYYNVLGGVFGNEYGWIPYAPVFILSLAAIGCLWVVAPRWTTM